jgi:hypothetical protein
MGIAFSQKEPFEYIEKFAYVNTQVLNLYDITNYKCLKSTRIEIPPQQQGFGETFASRQGWDREQTRLSALGSGVILVMETYDSNLVEVYFNKDLQIIMQEYIATSSRLTPLQHMFNCIYAIKNLKVAFDDPQSPNFLQRKLEQGCAASDKKLVTEMFNGMYNEYTDEIDSFLKSEKNITVIGKLHGQIVPNNTMYNIHEICYDKYEKCLYVALANNTMDIHEIEIWKRHDSGWTYQRATNISNFNIIGMRQIVNIKCTRHHLLMCTMDTIPSAAGLTTFHNTMHIIRKKTLYNIQSFDGCHPAYLDYYEKWYENRLETLKNIECLMKISTDILEILLLYLG